MRKKINLPVFIRGARKDYSALEMYIGTGLGCALSICGNIICHLLNQSIYDRLKRD
jgi:hypothetical protein